MQNLDLFQSRVEFGTNLGAVRTLRANTLMCQCSCLFPGHFVSPFGFLALDVWSSQKVWYEKARKIVVMSEFVCFSLIVYSSLTALGMILIRFGALDHGA